MFRLCSTYVSTVLGLCFDCARPMFRLSWSKSGVFWLSLPMFWGSRQKSGIVHFFQKKNWHVPIFSTHQKINFDFIRLTFARYQLFSTYVSTIIDQCFDCARPIFRHSRAKLCMFRLCSTYVLTVLDLFLTVLHLCFACARLMFWLCSAAFVLTVLDLYFDCPRPVFWLRSAFLPTVIDLLLTVLDLFFECARTLFRLCSTYLLTVLNYVW